MASVLLEARPYRPFKSSEEYLEAMREDLAEWLNTLYPELMINADNFMDRLDTGVSLCKHANNVRKAAEEYLARRQARNKSMTRSMTSGLAGPILAMGNVHYLPAAKSGTFFARDNVSNFITWCRKSLKIFECLLFETDDLIMRKNEKHVILCLLEVARRGAKFGMLAPMLVQMERQIDREIAADNKANGIGCGTQTDLNGTNNISTETEMFDTDTEDEDDGGPMLFYGPQPQIITNDLKSLDEMVRDLVEKCTCPSQFPMVRVSEGKYRIGDTKVLIFVRILRSHVMVRVGGGWDTLSHYLDKHDPCRCRAQHRTSVAARLIPRTNNQTNGIELHKAQVIFERSPPSARRVISVVPTSFNGSSSPNIGSNHHSKANLNTLSPPTMTRNRSRSPTPHRKFPNSNTSTATNHGGNVNDSSNNSERYQQLGNHPNTSSPSLSRRSMSPSPRRLSEFRKKQTSLDSSSFASSKIINGTESNAVHHVQFDHIVLTTESKQQQQQENVSNTNGLIPTEISTKFENISDNGSEISDEGYRSLGIIQPGVASSNSNCATDQKCEFLHSQTSVDDAEMNARLEQTSSDFQISPTDENSLNKTPENLESNSSDMVDTISTNNTISPQTQSEPSVPITDVIVTNNFEKSGVFITDDEITVDIASATGLRKTGFSDKIYGEDGKSSTIKKSTSKIPRSPGPIRRRSMDNAASECGSSEVPLRTGLPVFSRKQPAYKSVRKSVESKEAPVKDVTNTWSGRTTKKRPTISTDTFSSPNKSFERNTKGRSSQVMYDSNGRRIKGTSSSVNTSPVKSSTSPLAQQILEAATSAKNDAQILEKMKKLLTQYSNSLNNGSGSGRQKKPIYDDFTSAWVHSNGTLERSASCSPPTKGYSKRSSAASSTESTHSKDLSVIMSSRRDKGGSSRIPAPVRNNTELY